MVRLCLLLLLAMLLPWRGAVAAAMLCPPAAAPAQQALPAHPHALVGAAGQHHGHAHHDHQAQPRQGQDSPDDGLQAPSGTSHADHTGQDSTCQLCAATCSVTALPEQALELPAPTAAAASRFPALVAPVPDFLSDGQERPPRSI